MAPDIPFEDGGLVDVREAIIEAARCQILVVAHGGAERQREGASDRPWRSGPGLAPVRDAPTKGATKETTAAPSGPTLTHTGAATTGLLATTAAALLAAGAGLPALARRRREDEGGPEEASPDDGATDATGDAPESPGEPVASGSPVPTDPDAPTDSPEEGRERMRLPRVPRDPSGHRAGRPAPHARRETAQDDGPRDLGVRGPATAGGRG